MKHIFLGLGLSLLPHIGILAQPGQSGVGGLLMYVLMYSAFLAATFILWGLKS